MRRLSGKILIPIQSLATLAALAALVMWPPAKGAMMLVPLAGGDANTMAQAALAGGALLLGPGILPGSIVVVGTRSRVAGALRSVDAVILAAPRAGCGDARDAAAMS